jgi:hypothetical protein
MTDAGSLALTQIILKKWNFQYDASSYFIPVSEKRSSDLSKMLNIDGDNLEEFLRPTFLFHVFDNRAQLKGNTGNVCILHSPSSLTGKRLLIFGDSFIKDALPFFAPIFRDIVYIRSPNFQSDIVELIQPDFVITSNAERYLCNVTADSLSSPLLLSQYGDNNYSPTLSFKEAYIAQFSWGHHRIFYEHWVKKITANMMKWNELGLCQPNNQIESIGLDGGFRSLGVDPYFTFLKARISPEKKYVIEFDLKSDSNTLASVYFQTIEDERFTEEKTIKSTVNKGDNHLVFLLPAVKLNSIIRIDPLCCPGIFFINNVTLKEVS